MLDIEIIDAGSVCVAKTTVTGINTRVATTEIQVGPESDFTYLGSFFNKHQFSIVKSECIGFPVINPVLAVAVSRTYGVMEIIVV